MKLSEYRSSYYDISGRASDASRQLAFAGIALVWIFKTGNDGNYSLDSGLYVPVLALIICLTADLLQYVAGSVIWGLFHRHHEKIRESPQDDPEIEADPKLNLPANIFFYVKLLAVSVAYFCLFRYAAAAIAFQGKE